MRAAFDAMRTIAWTRGYVGSTGNRRFDSRATGANAHIFYLQALHMKDFEDDYGEIRPFSSYFPFYQQMSHEQLRTYFTWRTQVRLGDVRHVPLSYAFVYVYELLHNVGVADHAEGLDRLLWFAGEFAGHDPTVERYVLRWIPDYRVYYGVYGDTGGAAPKAVGAGRAVAHGDVVALPPCGPDAFGAYAYLSGYDMAKSPLFGGGERALLEGCFLGAVDGLREAMEGAGLDFGATLFGPRRKATQWKPFGGALFHPWLRQPDRRAAIIGGGTYACKGGDWSFGKESASDGGRKLIAYILKATDRYLRGAASQKGVPKAGLSSVGGAELAYLRSKGLDLTKVVGEAIAATRAAMARIVIKMDDGALDRIREEALLTQERLTVAPEGTVGPIDGMGGEAALGPYADTGIASAVARRMGGEAALGPYADTGIASAVARRMGGEAALGPHVDSGITSADDRGMGGEAALVPNAESAACGWPAFFRSLTRAESEALAEASASGDITAAAKRWGTMPEPLADSINQKALAALGDNVMEYGTSASVYDEYAEAVGAYAVGILADAPWGPRRDGR